MTYSYYPGCTLKTKAKELDLTARQAAAALGITLEEPPEWQCCGAVYPLAQDEIATKFSPVRTLAYASHHNQKLLTLCSACHHVLKRVNDDMKTNEDQRRKVNNYLQYPTPYAGETQVVHYLEMLRDEVGFDKLKTLVKKPLAGKKVGAYYGCLLLRPSSVMNFDDAENPTIMEDFIRALGGEPVVYPFRNECCGGYVTVKNRELARQMCHRIFQSAEEQGAQELITACPLFMYNLEVNGPQGHMPVTYFTQLLAQALDIPPVKEAQHA